MLKIQLFSHSYILHFFLCILRLKTVILKICCISKFQFFFTVNAMMIIRDYKKKKSKSKAIMVLCCNTNYISTMHFFNYIVICIFQQIAIILSIRPSVRLCSP